MYISDEQLHAMQHCIYIGIKVQVEGLDGECISQMCQCTGRQSWHGRDQRNDWVWVTQCPGRCYGALNGRLPWQLQRLPENSVNLDSISKFVQVRKTPAAIALQVFRVGNIVGCMHIIPEIATSCKT